MARKKNEEISEEIFKLNIFSHVRMDNNLKIYLLWILKKRKIHEIN